MTAVEKLEKAKWIALEKAGFGRLNLSQIEKDALFILEQAHDLKIFNLQEKGLKRRQKHLNQMRTFQLQKQLNKEGKLYNIFFSLLPKKMQEALQTEKTLKFAKESGLLSEEELDILKKSIEARKKGKGAGEFEVIGAAWKRIQSAVMKPEFKHQKEMLSITKKLQAGMDMAVVELKKIEEKKVGLAP